MLLIVSILALWLHPIHVSICEIEYNNKNNSLEIVHKIFLDDLDNALERECGIKLQMGTRFEHRQGLDYMQAYLKKHFEVSVAGIVKPFEWIGHEADLEAMWIYLEVPKVDTSKEIVFKNTVLLDFFDDQKNILHFRHQDFRKSFMFQRNEFRGTLYLN